MEIKSRFHQQKNLINKSAVSRLDMSEEEFMANSKNGIPKRVILGSAKPNQTAKYVKMLDFYVGIFSYLLTQYLWQETATPEVAIPERMASRIAYTNKQIPPRLNQNPLYEIETRSRSKNQAMYFSENYYPVANAVVTEVKGNQAQICFGD